MGSKLQCSGLALKIFTSKISSSNQVKSWFSRSQKNGGSPNYLGNKHSEKKSAEWQTIGSRTSLGSWNMFPIQTSTTKICLQSSGCPMLPAAKQSKQVDAGPSDSPISHVDGLHGLHISSISPSGKRKPCSNHSLRSLRRRKHPVQKQNLGIFWCKIWKRKYPDTSTVHFQTHPVLLVAGHRLLWQLRGLQDWNDLSTLVPGPCEKKRM